MWYSGRVLGFCFWLLLLSHFFFFKQKTAYDMRISDCSSDVCSSDLQPVAAHRPGAIGQRARHARPARIVQRDPARVDQWKIVPRSLADGEVKTHLSSDPNPVGLHAVT